MATFHSTIEGQSISRPPFFTGSNYTYWKVRMQIFLQSLDFDLWDIVENGYTKPTTATSTWKAEDKAKFNLNSKAMNALLCALDSNEFNRISTCKTAKEIWDKLAIVHEGTNQVKESKINMLTRDYEMFCVQPNESITDMYTRFTNIINSLKALGKDFSDADLVRKILRSFPQNGPWEPKLAAIQEARDLDKFSLEELMGSLMTYELRLKTEPSTSIIHTETKNIALNSNEGDGGDSDDATDDEISLLSRRLKKIIQRKNGGRWSGKGNNSRTNFLKKDVKCYKCNKTGHISYDCQNQNKSPRKEKKKNKAFSAAWSDDSDSDKEEPTKEVSNLSLTYDDAPSNLCFMADIEDEVNDLTHDELLEVFYDLYDDLQKFGPKYASLKKENISLISDVNLLKSENKCLKNELSLLKKQLETKSNGEHHEEISFIKTENESLKKDLIDSRNTLERFIGSTKALNMMLGNQRSYLDKTGLGYQHKSSQKKNISKPFVKYSNGNKNVLCTYCNKIGHHVTQCQFRNKFKLRQLWVVKGSNTSGPKSTWVPFLT